MSAERLPVLGEAHNHPEPQDKEEKTTVYSVGGKSIEDIAWGTVVYRKCTGTVLNLWDAPGIA